MIERAALSRALMEYIRVAATLSGDASNKAEILALGRKTASCEVVLVAVEAGVHCGIFVAHEYWPNFFPEKVLIFSSHVVRLQIDRFTFQNCFG